MSESMGLYLEDKMEACSYPSVSEYIRELIRRDQITDYERMCQAIELRQRAPDQWRPIGQTARSGGNGR